MKLRSEAILFQEERIFFKAESEKEAILWVNLLKWMLAMQ